ncbi:MAG: hypothetical protein DRI77_01800 [Chloroflexi bacterium]|nr:MAG: hypothetical protein DRI77_01800 [Chloroflexota bacterium]
MKNRSNFIQQGPTVWSILGWIVLVALGMGLIWIGFVRPFGTGKSEPSAAATELPVSTAADSTPTTVLYPTFTPLAVSPLPTVVPTEASTTLPPTAVSPTQVPSTPGIVAGDKGVNVRSGPGTNYTKLGYLEPGSQAEVTGRYSDWWQIKYNGRSGWVFGELVTASDVASVAQVEPPPAPTAAPVTAVPPTAPPPPTAAPVTDVRGLHPDKFEVEGAPGPYKLGNPIWFNMWITNQTSASVEYEYLGVQVEETGAVQKSWVYSEFSPNQHFSHHDQMHDKISAPGTYHLWLVIQFRDGNGFRLMGPVEVVVQ